MRAPSTEAARFSAGSGQAGALLPKDRPTAAVIDLAALAANYREVQQRIGDRAVLAVVKAQAYGHGAVPVSRHLVSLGAGMLGVALVEEGRELREAGIGARILLMGGVFPAQAEEIVRLDLVTALTSLPMAHALSEAARAQGRTAAVHVKVDTGMGRIGLSPDAAGGFVNDVLKLGNLHVEGIMTHFADADLQDKQFAKLQMERFDGLIRTLERKGIAIPIRHAANSAAVLDFPEALFNMVRPGLMLYGYDPLERASCGAAIRPVLSLVTRILFLKRVPAGTPVSYGRTYTTRRESVIATIAAGYADGYSRALSNKGHALVRGRKAGIAGRVCMDMTMLDVTDIPDAREGDEVVLIGSQENERVTAGDIAAVTGTIPYEVLCGISGRVPRVYVE